jgi:hypothetical protein
MQRSWLFLTKAQVEGMGGTITVESMVDVGTKFEIIFKNYNMDNKLIIAIIDDDTIFQFIGKRFIESFESVNKTLIFSDGKDAIDFYTLK